MRSFIDKRSELGKLEINRKADLNLCPLNLCYVLPFVFLCVVFFGALTGISGAEYFNNSSLNISSSAELESYTEGVRLSIEPIFYDGKSLSGIPVNYELRAYPLSDSELVVGSSTPDKDNKIVLFIPKAFYEIKLNVDDDRTPGFDYYGKISSSIDETSSNLKLVLLPVGSLKVVVVSERGKPVAGALVNTDCSRNYAEQEYFRTDDFGFVHARFLPVGDCIIRATYGDELVSKKINLEKGSRSEIVIEMKFNEGFEWAYLVIIVVLVFIGGLVFLFFRGSSRDSKERGNKKEEKNQGVLNGARFVRAKKRSQNSVKPLVIKRKKPSKISESSSFDGSSISMQDREAESSGKPDLSGINLSGIKLSNNSAKEDILVALSDNERKVVRFMLEEEKKNAKDSENQGKYDEGFYVSQSKIVYGAGLPKTSLARVLDSLQKKNIVVVEKIGKLKKISFNSWFKSK